MKIEMLDGYVVEIKVKKVDEKRFSDSVTKNFLNILCLILRDANKYESLIKSTYLARIAGGMSSALYTELENAGYYKEGR